MDKAQFEKRFSKVSSFNRGRFAIARQIMTKNVNEVLDLVPILIHYNHPAIPGYRKNGVPFGIDMFTPNDFQRKYLQDRGIDPDEKTESFWPVYALYAMGSTSLYFLQKICIRFSHTATIPLLFCKCKSSL